MTRRDEAGLIGVTDASFLAAQARVRRLKREEAGLRDQLAELDAARKRLSIDAAPGAAQAAARWLGWIATRQEELNGALARVRAQEAALLQDLRHAFGRKQAMRAILRRMEEDRAQTAARRDAYFP